MRLLTSIAAILAGTLGGQALAQPQPAQPQPAQPARPAQPPPAQPPPAQPAVDPNAFDPILDTPREADPGRERRVSKHDPRSPGFTVGTHIGAYMGAVRSYLTTDLSTLEDTARANIGFGIGYRTASLIELGVDLDLGLGQTFEPEIDRPVFAFDLLTEPRILAHYYETESFSAYAGVGLLSILFDLELEGINQAGAGPTFIVGVQWRTDRHSLLYLEGSISPFYDWLAYRYRDPTESELEADPLLSEVRIDGEWFTIVRLTLGYRLSAL